MGLDISNKAVTMMLKTVIGSLGIDGEALMSNIMGFQQFVMNCIGKHDSRLVAIEQAQNRTNELLSQLLEQKNGTSTIESLRLIGRTDSNPDQFAVAEHRNGTSD